MTSESEPTLVEVETKRMATGGEAVAHLDTGQVIFVRGALDGETVQVDITESKKRFARGIVTNVLDPSPWRVEPGCSHAASGQCGGCDWMFVDHGEQLRAKERIVAEQLQRLGGIDAPVVTTLDVARGHRTTVRCSVVDGRAGYRARRSDVGFAASECGAAHPLLEDLIVDGRFGDATEVTLRVGAATAERLCITNGQVGAVSLPADVQVVSAKDPGDAAIHEVVAGRRWRISARSFFQTSLEGAEALVGTVSRALAGTDGNVVDLYAGVGLLGGAAVPGRLGCVVESSPSSAADASHNLDAHVKVIQSQVEQWKPGSFAGVVADPARRGLGPQGAAVIDKTGATTLVLVSCDPASLGRDAALLLAAGWEHEHAEMIDMFPDTSRIEVVSTFRR